MAKATDKPELKKRKKEDWPKFIDDIIRNHPAVNNKHQVMGLCKNFFKGEQYKWIDPKTNRVKDVEVTRETRCIYNFIRVFIKTLTSKLTAGNPQPHGKPHTHNTERFDRDVARAANPLIRWWWRREHMDRKLKRFVRDAGKLGVGILRLYYEPYDEESEEPGVPRVNEYDIVQPEVKIPGRFRCKPGNPRHYFPDPVAIDDDERRWVLSISAMAKDLAEEKFGKKFRADNKIDLEEDVEETTRTVDYYEISDELEGTEIVILKDLELMPSQTYPNGKHIVVINEEVLVDEDATEGDEEPCEYELSYYTYRVNREDDEYFGQGYVYPLLTLQRDYNKSQSMVMENMTASGVNKKVIVLGAVDPNTVTDDPWDTIPVKDTDGKWSDKIGTIRAEPYPNYIVSNPDSILQKAMFILGLNPIDFSLIPEKGAQSPGVVIRELKESSKVAFSDDINELKAVISDITMRFLRLVQLHLNEDQIAKIIGENYRPNIRKFLEASISKDTLDIDINVGIGFDESTASRIDDITKLTQMGIFTPIEAKRAMHDYGNMDALLEKTFLDEEQAHRNLDAILDGVPASSIVVSQFANHDAHIKVFSDFVKTPEWEGLDQQVKLQVDQYLMQMMGHKQALGALQAPPQMGPGTGPPGQGARPGPAPQPPNLLAQQEAQENQRMSPGRPQIPQGMGAGNIGV